MGTDAHLRKAWEKAFATDKQAPFGGIIVCNRSMDEPLARAISEIFSEVIIAPEFDPKAGHSAKEKKSSVDPPNEIRLRRASTPEIRSVAGGLLVQDADAATEEPRKVVTKRQADRDRACCHVVRVARRETRQIKRDCLCGVGPDPWGGSRTDVAHRRFPHSDLESRRGGIVPQGERGGERCIFSVP